MGRSGQLLVTGSSISNVTLVGRGSGDLTVAGASGAAKMEMRGAGNAMIIGTGSPFNSDPEYVEKRADFQANRSMSEIALKVSHCLQLLI